MARNAREELRPDAEETEVEELANRRLEGRRRRAPAPETPIERWERQTQHAMARADVATTEWRV